VRLLLRLQFVVHSQNLTATVSQAAHARRIALVTRWHLRLEVCDVIHEDFSSTLHVVAGRTAHCESKKKRRIEGGGGRGKGERRMTVEL
jgi:hypothetical protein